MLAGKGRRWRKGRALFVFRQDSGVIAQRSDLQVLYEAHLALAARSESGFPWKTPDSVWQGLFAVAGVIVRSCHSSLGYLLQSTLTSAISPCNNLLPFSPKAGYLQPRQDQAAVCVSREGGRMPWGFAPASSPSALLRVLKKPLRAVTEPQGTLHRPTLWNDPWPARPWPQALCNRFPGGSWYFRPRPPPSQAAGAAVPILPCAFHSKSCKYIQFVNHKSPHAKWKT